MLWASAAELANRDAATAPLMAKQVFWSPAQQPPSRSGATCHLAKGSRAFPKGVPSYILCGTSIPRMPSVLVRAARVNWQRPSRELRISASGSERM